MSTRAFTFLTALTMSFALAAPAYATIGITPDPRGDGRKDTDLAMVKVVHRPKQVRLNTRTYPESSLTDEMWQVVDTGGGPRPEFLVFTVVFDEITFPTPRVTVYRIHRWPSRQNPYALLRQDRVVDCRQPRKVVRERQRVLSLTLSRGCFRVAGKLPKRLRVNTFTTLESGMIADSVPAWRRYGDWVPSTP